MESCTVIASVFQEHIHLINSLDQHDVTVSIGVSGIVCTRQRRQNRDSRVVIPIPDTSVYTYSAVSGGMSLKPSRIILIRSQSWSVHL